jgi:hypothetical protein
MRQGDIFGGCLFFRTSFHHEAHEEHEEIIMGRGSVCNVKKKRQYSLNSSVLAFRNLPLYILSLRGLRVLRVVFVPYQKNLMAFGPQKLSRKQSARSSRKNYAFYI